MKLGMGTLLIYLCRLCSSTQIFLGGLQRSTQIFLCRYKLAVASSIYDTAQMAALMCSNSVTAILNACLSFYAPHETGGEYCQMSLVFSLSLRFSLFFN
jgi:hypothetical protein